MRCLEPLDRLLRLFHSLFMQMMGTGFRSLDMGNVSGLEILVKLPALLGRDIVDVDSDVVAELGRDFLQREASGFRPEEVDHREEDDAPANDDEVVFPSDRDKANWCGLEEDNRGCELPEEREPHPDRPDLRWEDF